MKLLNLKFITFLFCLVFSFNSSARIFERVLTDVTKAAKAGGSDISGWKTCEDDGGGFNPDHVHKVVATDNNSPCDENDQLVKKYQNNFVSISGQSSKGGYHTTAGFLTDGCSRVVTSGHVFYELDQKTKLKKFFVITYPEKKTHDIGGNPPIKEGPWKKTTLYSDEVSYMEVKNIKNNCAAVNMISDVVEIKNLSVSGNMDFYLLKLNKNNKLCAQRCQILSSSVNKASIEAYTSGSIEHDCGTEGGDSGSPVFARARSGNDYFVGIHTGPNPNKTKVNLFAPASAQMLDSLINGNSVSK